MDFLLKEEQSDEAIELALEKASEGGDNEFVSFVFSDASIDRAGDSIDASGWELDNFKSNPVILWAHDSGTLPVGKAVATYVINNQLKGIVQFAGNDLAQEVKAAYQGGFMNAVSVGFQPKEWNFNEERGFMAVDFYKQELLETSAVPVPCHPGALAEARSKGLTNLVPHLEEMLKGVPTETLKQEILTREPPQVNIDYETIVREALQEVRQDALGTLAATYTRLTGRLD